MILIKSVFRKKRVFLKARLARGSRIRKSQALQAFGFSPTFSTVRLTNCLVKKISNRIQKKQLFLDRKSCFLFIDYFIFSMSSGRTLSNLAPYQCLGSFCVFSIQRTVKSAAIFADSKGAFSFINAPTNAEE